MRLRIIWIIFCKELTEALRDRITLLVLIGLPLLMYPLAVMTTFQVAKFQAAAEETRVFKVAIWGTGATPLFDWLSLTTNRLTLARWQGMPEALRLDLEAGRLQPPPPIHRPSFQRDLPPGFGISALELEEETADKARQAARAVVSSRQADAVLIIWPGYDDAIQQHERGQVSVYYDSVIPESGQAWSRLSGLLSQFRERLLKERRSERGLPKGFFQALEVREDDVAPLRRQVSNVLGRVLPVFLIMLSVVGAMTAAGDMTAGEKDRATMQTLLCAPVRSLEIVGGKFLAVWTVSLISATANLTGVCLTIGRVAASLHVDVIPWWTLAAAMALLLPATWTIAALLLGIAVLGRDAKDAANFLGATAISVILPASVALLPGVELDGWTCCVPLVNVSLLIRALTTGTVAAPLVCVTLLTSLTYAGLALCMAARMFGREQNLLGGAFSWRWLLFGEAKRYATPTPWFVLTLFPVAVVGLFYLSLSIDPHRLMALLLATQWGVLFLPAVLLAWVRKFPMAQTFSLNPPHWRSLVGSALIGLSASTAIAGLVLRLAPPPDSLVKQMEEMLHLGDLHAPLWKLWLLIALTPALCEETFFRGLMLSGLRRWGPWAAIGLTALFFGLLHGSIYRLLPTFLLGLLLGYAVWRSGSLFCSILIHGLNNGLIATLAWRSGGNDADMQSVPWSLTLGALAVLSLGVGLLTRPKPKQPDGDV